MVACRKGITKFGQKYGHKRRVLLLNCLDKLIKCDVQQELDGTNGNGCRSTAKTSCDNTIGASGTPLANHRQLFHDKATLACAAAPFPDVLSNLAGGLWYSNDVNCGASADLPTLIDCLRDQWLEPEADELVGQLKPRGGLLLDNIGLGDEFPNLPRPPIFDVIVAAVAPDMGDMINPGTIAPGAGTAVRFSGDAVTLPCGMSANNGRIVVTIVPLADPCNSANVLQEFTFKEPYGTTRNVTVGPYTTDVTYCLDLKDGSCDDVETGTIDMP
jgi:hypothetical protein